MCVQRGRPSTSRVEGLMSIGTDQAPRGKDVGVIVFTDTHRYTCACESS